MRALGCVASAVGGGRILYGGWGTAAQALLAAAVGVGFVAPKAPRSGPGLWTWSVDPVIFVRYGAVGPKFPRCQSVPLLTVTLTLFASLQDATSRNGTSTPL